MAILLWQGEIKQNEKKNYLDNNWNLYSFINCYFYNQFYLYKFNFRCCRHPLDSKDILAGILFYVITAKDNGS